LATSNEERSNKDERERELETEETQQEASSGGKSLQGPRIQNIFQYIIPFREHVLGFLSRA
jgi:hypothetical protein